MTDRLYLAYDPPDWYRELNFEDPNRRGSQNLRISEWYNLEVFVLPKRDRDSFYAPVRNYWRSYESEKALRVADFTVLSSLSDSYYQCSSLQRVMIARIDEVRFSILSICAFLRAARVGVIEQLSFYRMKTSHKSRDAILRVPFSLIKRMAVVWHSLASRPYGW